MKPVRSDLVPDIDGLDSPENRSFSCISSRCILAWPRSLITMSQNSNFLQMGVRRCVGSCGHVAQLHPFLFVNKLVVQILDSCLRRKDSGMRSAGWQVLTSGKRQGASLHPTRPGSSRRSSIKPATGKGLNRSFGVAPERAAINGISARSAVSASTVLSPT